MPPRDSYSAEFNPSSGIGADQNRGISRASDRRPEPLAGGHSQRIGPLADSISGQKLRGSKYSVCRVAVECDYFAIPTAASSCGERSV